jgi:iron complex transport system ATP-binding protein
MSIILHLHNVSVALQDTEVLSSISFDLEAGTYTSIIGQNGAGKSSLLKAILGLLDFSGRITILDQDLRNYSQKNLAKVIAYVPQKTELAVNSTVCDFLALSRYAYRGLFLSDRKRDKTAIADAVEQVAIGDLLEKKVFELSGGEQQRVLIASAIVQQAKLLLLDEASSSLDPGAKNQLAEILKSLVVEQGLTILAVHHDINLAALSSSRVLALKKGELIFDSQPEALMTLERLQDIYQTEFLLVQHPTEKLQVVIPRSV